MFKGIQQRLRSAARIIYRNRTFVLYEMPLEDSGIPPNAFLDSVPLGYRLYNRDENGLATSLMLKADVPYKNVTTKISRRFKSGCMCCVAFWDGIPCHYSWICFGQREILGLTLDLPPRTCFIFDCYTFSEYRGRSIYPATLRHLASVFQRENYSRIFIDVENFNTPSKRGVRKAGFKELQQIKRPVILNRFKRRSSKSLASLEKNMRADSKTAKDKTTVRTK